MWGKEAKKPRCKATFRATCDSSLTDKLWNRTVSGTSLVVTRSAVSRPQLKIPHATTKTRHSQISKFKKTNKPAFYHQNSAPMWRLYSYWSPSPTESSYPPVMGITPIHLPKAFRFYKKVQVHVRSHHTWLRTLKQFSPFKGPGRGCPVDTLHAWGACPLGALLLGRVVTGYMGQRSRPKEEPSKTRK